jgi:hypothetical protein
MVVRPGFEPGLKAPKARVLPLHYRTIRPQTCTKFMSFANFERKIRVQGKRINLLYKKAAGYETALKNQRSYALHQPFLFSFAICSMMDGEEH